MQLAHSFDAVSYILARVSIFMRCGIVRAHSLNISTESEGYLSIFSKKSLCKLYRFSIFERLNFAISHDIFDWKAREFDWKYSHFTSGERELIIFLFIRMRPWTWTSLHWIEFHSKWHTVLPSAETIELERAKMHDPLCFIASNDSLASFVSIWHSVSLLSLRLAAVIFIIYKRLIAERQRTNSLDLDAAQTRVASSWRMAEILISFEISFWMLQPVCSKRYKFLFILFFPSNSILFFISFKRTHRMSARDFIADSLLLHWPRRARTTESIINLMRFGMDDHFGRAFIQEYPDRRADAASSDIFYFLFSFRQRNWI